MIIFIYAVLVFLVLRFSVTLFNFLSNPKLSNHGKRFNDKVSIVLPFDNDEKTELFLIALEEQDYKDIEVLIRRRGESDLSISNRASGVFLFFTDAESRLRNGLINNLIYRSRVFNLSLLSLIPTRKCKNILQRCFYPLVDFVLLNTFPLRLAKVISRPAFMLSNTACMFYHTETFRLYQEGKQPERYKAEILLANRFLYSEGEPDLNVISKQLLQVLGNNILVALFYVALAVIGPVFLMLKFNFAFFALPLGLIFLSRIMSSFLTRQNPLINVLLHPVQMLLIFWLLMRGVFNKLRKWLFIGLYFFGPVHECVNSFV